MQDVGDHFELSELLQRGIERSDNPTGAVLRELLRAARRHLGLEIGFIARFEGDRRVFQYVDEDQPSGLLRAGTGDPLEETYCRRVVDGRLPEVMADAREWPAAAELPVTHELGIRTHVSVPVRLSNGTVYGTFCCFGLHVDHSLGERDNRLMHVFADLAARLLEKEAGQVKVDKEARDRVQAVIDDDRFHMVWQPILALTSGELMGLEALARFDGEPSRPPDVWFSEAAKVGLADALEVATATMGLSITPRLPENVYVSVNIGAKALLSPGFARDVAQIAPGQTVIELTEHDVVSDYEAIIRVLESAREDGLRVAVDDAGAGYATLRHILTLRPDIIKLDKSLVRDLNVDVGRRALAMALVQFAAELGTRLVAEGIETQAELDSLRRLGVEYGQGYFLSKPLTESAAVRLAESSAD